jgi:NAD(P)-dependent dehydrogenase (short-subunit alcohol dehydrogenase family)
MPMLSDKVVIVSGIGPGLGQELAFAAGREGAHVVLAARSEPFLREIEARTRKLGARTLVVPTDITDRAQCARLVEASVAEFGRVDALINSAYTGGEFAPFEKADLGEWRRTMDVNCFGTLALSQEVVPQMKAQGGGAIVMINSMVQKKPLPTQGGYALSKGALHIATKILAKELGAHGIRVNGVFMGWMWGPPVEGYVKQAAQQQNLTERELIAGITREIPLGFIPDDADCANAAIFLASDYARVITGASLDVNGGEFMP